MSMVGAFARSRTLLKQKVEIPMAMSKWWAKKNRANGEVSKRR
jgi:hypothetical protein